MSNSYHYHLPPELIAQRPARPRDHARLLVYDRGTRRLRDDYFYNLEKYLVAGSTIVLNNSKVEKCRLLLPGGLELLVTDTFAPTTFVAMVRPGKKFRVGAQLHIAGLTLQVLKVRPDGLRVLKSSHVLNDPILAPFRATPFPPYIAQDEKLAGQYQTMYAKKLGSKAAPTAGLHFTRAQLQQLANQHELAEITLHVGLGTFAPVKGKIEDHIMHSEGFEMTAAAARRLNQAEHITAVGTTTVRTLESLTKPFKQTRGETAIFIQPGFEFQVVNSLITNFHLPNSTLLMLVAAFIGSIDEMQRIYEHATSQHYRFYSFGDAMLIL
jgi:S-adenosylmethionine:tRNA ribosyltransferase-isomerase